MRRAVISTETARQLGLDMKEEGDVCELFIRAKNGDGTVEVESDYEERASSKPRAKEPASHFERAIRSGRPDY